MRKTNIGGRSVVIYDAIDELPIKRFHKFNKMLLVDAGIGSDLADVDAHIQKSLTYYKQGKPDLAATELENLRQNIYFVQSELSPKHLAFACLVKEIDGRACDDISDNGLAATLELISNAKHVEITASIEAVKKKIDDDLQAYFPNLFEDASEKEFYDQLKRRTMLVLQSITDGQTNESEIERITIELLQYNKPRQFTGKNNAELQYDKNFERMCVTLSHNLHIEPKNLSVMEFYNAFEYLKDQLKAQNKPRNAK